MKIEKCIKPVPVKPLTVTFETVEEIIDFALRFNISPICMVDQNYKYSACSNGIKELMKDARGSDDEGLSRWKKITAELYNRPEVVSVLNELGITWI